LKKPKTVTEFQKKIKANHREMAAIQADYNQSCGVAGELGFKIEVMKAQILKCHQEAVKLEKADDEKRKHLISQAGELGYKVRWFENELQNAQENILRYAREADACTARQKLKEANQNATLLRQPTLNPTELINETLR
jgi:spore coat polysaccharide biosynthesis protein SpsF (cytidylyltransferase family)